MNWDHIEQRWDLYIGTAVRTWDKLPDGELRTTGGDRSRLIRLLKDRYGYLSPFAEDEVDRFYAICAGVSGDSVNEFPSGRLIAPPDPADEYISS